MTSPTPPSEQFPPPPVVRRGAVVWSLVGAFALIALLVGAVTVQIPYYAIAPGNAVSVAGLVKVVDGPSYPPEGEIFLCTVSLRRATVFEAIEGWLDPTVDVVEEETIVPKDVGPRRLREFNLQLMDDSKEKALVAAFAELGYDVVRGTGAQVVQIVEDSPADGTLEPGDTIVAVDGEPVELHTDAIRLLGEHEPGDVVRFTVEPEEGPSREVEVRLEAHPDDAGRPFVGVTLGTRDQRFDFPFEVDIASDRIGGPSAGLAFTLEVLDVLTEGELTGGRRVAATGTMELDGTVGQVGGVAQKTVAVQEQGVDIFLVPEGEVAEARRLAGDDLRVEAVGTLGDALRILAEFGGNGLALPRPVDPGT